ncbi:2-oxoglutarate dehydrogenase, E2 component, dihydrolipoamide succinyltransferase [Actinotalea sp. BY-33]|uniref:Dihydrolipoamide acetyltransferase component of pyruvate dehydrogenase complex n=1 Tax=Actinotalea soli TaxID=2819234 RepID=A0A939LMZ9_9CELL|nr:2-oxoglutarate dehydrogenase, E2 component, dihydrolipoamide succinyltransferase [Actinotalea soli]MBO1750616.1 2-oxoglutarate dehydrogenase, E2 component, dihydrolipoamide succinyltransferase [Actinotalea soli]
MSDSVQMPALGESVTEGTVTRWLKQVGDQVEVDEPLLEVSTDKVDTEIPSPFAGTLTEILVEEDDTVEVGTALATIGSADEAGGSGDAPAKAEEAPAEEAPAEEPATEEPQVPEEVTEAPAEQSDEAPDAPQESAAPAEGSQGGGEQVEMPALGESVTEGTVTRWLKQVGDQVEVDEPLLEVSTDKVDTEIPSPFAGTLTEILVEEDETVEVGTALARIGGSASSGGEPAQAEKAPEPEPESTSPEQASTQSTAAPEEPAQQEQPVQEPQPSPEASSTTAPGQTGDREAQDTSAAGGAARAGGYLTPLVRKLAAEKGVDLDGLTGTGVGGRIRKEDVLEAAEKAAAEKQKSAPAAETPAAPEATERKAEVSPLRGTTEKASRLRQIIAERMVDALHSMAQLTTVVEVDVTAVAKLRTQAKNDFKAREGVNLTFLPFFVLAATEALKAHPKVNGVLEGKEITYHGQENVGIAVDTERGLLVPVIRDAGDLNLAGIARKIADLASRTRDNKATPDDLSGATFTVTNTGSGGALIDTPIVPGGTSAILGTGAIVKRPVVATDEYGQDYIAIRSMCYLSLSYDHRLVDGADASRYLMAVKKRIEEADFESEVGL